MVTFPLSPEAGFSKGLIPPTNACHGGLRNIPLSVLGRQVSVVVIPRPLLKPALPRTERDVIPPTNACHGGLVGGNIPSLSPWQAGFSKGRSTTDQCLSWWLETCSQSWQAGFRKPPPTNGMVVVFRLSLGRQVSETCLHGTENIPLSVLGKVSVGTIPPTNAGIGRWYYVPY